MPVRSMTLTTPVAINIYVSRVSDACQINDFDHGDIRRRQRLLVSDACQINDFDHVIIGFHNVLCVSDACQINDFDHDDAHTS